MSQGTKTGARNGSGTPPDRVEEQLAQDYFERGLARMRQYDYDRAILHFTQAIYIRPRAASYYFERGNAHRLNGSLEDALEDYSATIRFDENHSEAYFQRGTIRRDQFDLAGAIADFERYLRVCTGLCAEDRAEVEQSIRDLKRQLGT